MLIEIISTEAKPSNGYEFRVLQRGLLGGWVCVCVYVCVCVNHSAVSHSFATPWTVAHQAPSVLRFPRQEYWSLLPFPTLGDLPGPGIKSASPALAGRFFLPLHQLGSSVKIFTYHKWGSQGLWKGHALPKASG